MEPSFNLGQLVTIQGSLAVWVVVGRLPPDVGARTRYELLSVRGSDRTIAVATDMTDAALKNSVWWEYGPWDSVPSDEELSEFLTFWLKYEKEGNHIVKKRKFELSMLKAGLHWFGKGYQRISDKNFVRWAEKIEKMPKSEALDELTKERDYWKSAGVDGKHHERIYSYYMYYWVNTLYEIVQEKEDSEEPESALSPKPEALAANESKEPADIGGTDLGALVVTPFFQDGDLKFVNITVNGAPGLHITLSASAINELIEVFQQIIRDKNNVADSQPFKKEAT